jgi:hypothetical protein
LTSVGDQRVEWSELMSDGDDGAAPYERMAQAEWKARNARDDVVHETLWSVVRTDPKDYAPWGENRDREEGGDASAYRGDCSSGCRYYHPLRGALGSDWGVCANEASHRRSLLTFEHQGCPQFERTTDAAALIAVRDDAALPRDTRTMLFANYAPWHFAALTGIAELAARRDTGGRAICDDQLRAAAEGLIQRDDILAALERLDALYARLHPRCADGAVPTAEETFAGIRDAFHVTTALEGELKAR